jgi:hypothetical protein
MGLVQSSISGLSHEDYVFDVSVLLPSSKANGKVEFGPLATSEIISVNNQTTTVPVKPLLLSCSLSGTQATLLVSRATSNGGDSITEYRATFSAQNSSPAVHFVSWNSLRILESGEYRFGSNFAEQSVSSSNSHDTAEIVLSNLQQVIGPRSAVIEAINGVGASLPSDSVNCN